MIGRSMLAYVPVNLTSLIVSFGGIVILTRLLGSAEYGRYALAVITMMGVHMGFFTWLEAAMARYQARAERENDVSTHVKTIYMYALRTDVRASHRYSCTRSVFRGDIFCSDRQSASKKSTLCSSGINDLPTFSKPGHGSA